MLPSRLILACLAFAACWLGGQLGAQERPQVWKDGTTKQRLKSIYERGEFRARGYSARWSEDSQGFWGRGRASESGRPATLFMDAATGEPAKVQRPQPKRDNRNPQLSGDGKYRVEVRDGNVFLRDLESDERIRLTEREPGVDISYRGFRWSEGDQFVALVEADHRRVSKRNMLVPSDPSYPGIREQRFARVGGHITQLRVGIIDVAARKLNWLSIDSPDEGFYLGTVDWAPRIDSSAPDELLIEWLSRSRDRRKFLLAQADGQLTTIYEESDPAWVVASQGKNSGLTWVREGAAFIVVSEKQGWRQAFLVSREGKAIATLTPGKYDLIEKSIVDEPGGWYYFYASPENATEKYLYRVPLAGSGTRERITPAQQPGTHDYDFSPDAKWALHTVSTFDSPPVVELIEVEGHRVVKVLERNDRVRERLASWEQPVTEFLKLEIDGGVSMDAWMIKPKGFDATKKYPVFIYVYGEPHAQTVLNQWGAAQSHFLRVIAELGYLVVSIDNRGTPAPKGAAWRRSIFKSLGPLSTEDQVAGLRALGRERPYVDLSRVGIWGWSGGGSNTLNALFRKPDDYHVGIAVVPKPQPHLYNAWFQEIYMRTRESNPEGYRQSAPIHFAEGLRGKLLMVTGSGETNTHIQIIEGLVDRLVELGKQFDYMVYPNRNHGLSEGLGTVVHVRMLIARYLLENLPPGPR